MSPTSARPVWQSFVPLFSSLQHRTDTRYWRSMDYNIWGHQKKIPLVPYPPINSFFLLEFHLYLPGILFHYSLLCLYCKILRFLLGCFLIGTSSVPHSPVLSFQGQSKGQGWEVLESEGYGEKMGMPGRGTSSGNGGKCGQMGDWSGVGCQWTML